MRPPIVFGTLPFSVRIYLEGQVAWLPMRIMQEPGYDFEIQKKNGGKFHRVQHSGVWLQDIEQTCGCNMLKTLN